MNYKKTATRLRNGDFWYRGYVITRMPANEWYVYPDDTMPSLSYPVINGVEDCPKRFREVKQLIDAALEA